MFTKEYSSEEIVAGLMTGDFRIYKYLDSVYRRQVIKHVCANSGSHEEGEELYQDVIFEVYVNVEQDKYDVERSKFVTYFMMIARSRWTDKLRKYNRIISTTLLDETYEQISGTDEVEQAEQEQYYTRVRAMRQCIAQLNEEEQEMVRLFYYMKMSLEAVAQQMNISYKYAKQKLHRIRQKLRKMLSKNPNMGLQST